MGLHIELRYPSKSEPISIGRGMGFDVYTSKNIVIAKGAQEIRNADTTISSVFVSFVSSGESRDFNTPAWRLLPPTKARALTLCLLVPIFRFSAPVNLSILV